MLLLLEIQAWQGNIFEQNPDTAIGFFMEPDICSLFDPLFLVHLFHLYC